MATRIAETDKQTREKKRVSSLSAVFETGLIVTGLLLILLVLPHELGWDAWRRFVAISDLITKHSWSPTIKYSLYGPIFSVPFWILGRRLMTPMWWLERYNVFVFAAGLLATYWLLKDRVDRGLLRKFFLVLIVASMFPHHLLDYYGEIFTAMCIAVGTVAVIVGPELIEWLGWCLAALGIANTAVTIAGLLLVVLKHMLDKKRLRYLLVPVIAVGLMMFEYWIRRGNPFDTGYSNELGPRTIMPYSGLRGFSNPLFFGVISLLFSFGKGIFFFAPGLLLPVRRGLLKLGEKAKLNLYGLYVLWICFVIGLILIYAKWWAWGGGWFWGPRFLLFASIPASFALAVRLYRRDGSLLGNLLTLVVLCLSLWVGIDGAVFGLNGLGSYCVNSSLEMPLCTYTPEFTPLWHPFVVHPAISLSQGIYIGFSLIAGAYLAMPLVKDLLPQIREVAIHFSKAYLNVRTWHL